MGKFLKNTNKKMLEIIARHTTMKAAKSNLKAKPLDY
jgi:hypothetical protein